MNAPVTITTINSEYIAFDSTHTKFDILWYAIKNLFGIK